VRFFMGVDSLQVKDIAKHYGFYGLMVDTVPAANGN
jgi:hypothetical protein